MTTDESIRFRYERLAPTLDERSLRLFAATEAAALGRGGVSRVSRLTGMARSTITRGERELAEGTGITPGRIRRPGAGRKKVVALDPEAMQELERLVALTDTRDQRVILQLWREMRRRGLARLLADGGIEPGDTIRIGQVEVEWF